jgi:hypothetical protein
MLKIALARPGERFLIEHLAMKNYAVAELQVVFQKPRIQ